MIDASPAPALALARLERQERVVPVRGERLHAQRRGRDVAVAPYPRDQALQRREVRLRPHVPDDRQPQLDVVKV